MNEQATLKNWDSNHEFEVLGRSYGRLEGFEKVTGKAMYTSDIRLPGQLYASVLRSPWPHALILRVDCSRARRLPGVHAVLAATDQVSMGWCKGIGWYKEDEPLLGETVRFVGDEVAVVAAESSELAEDALDLIEVDYRPLPFVSRIEEALEEAAPPVRGQSNIAAEPIRYARGDFDSAWREAEVTLDATYTTPTALHNALESHGTTANWLNGELILYESTQGVFAVRDGVAKKLGLPQNRVRVIKEHMGGGFGAKQIPWKQSVLAALLSRMSGRPVQLMLDREAENLVAGNRNSTRQRVRIGARADGELTALSLEALLGIGAYTTNGEASNVSGIYQSLYRCPNVRTEQFQVYTNTGPAVAFRAPGYVEGAFGLESAMDELAVKLGIDPLELRRRNHTDHDQKKGLPYSSPEALKACYDVLEKKTRWPRKPSSPASENHAGRLRGIGIAANEWAAGAGNPPGYAWVKLNADGSAEVITASQDIGTGTRTMFAQVAAETLGIALSRVVVRLGDTAIGAYAPVSSGSATTPTMAPAIRAAAEDARSQLIEAACRMLETETQYLSIEHNMIHDSRQEHSVCALSEVTTHVAPRMIQGYGVWPANSKSFSIRPFSAQYAEVEVDTGTGEVTLLNILSAPDCGRILSPAQAESQVIGGIIQGIGYALTEERIVDTEFGISLNANLEDYKVPTAADIPQITHAAVNRPDLNANPVGAKGLGEPPLIPTAPAIVNAIYNATGVRLRELPVNPQRLLAALRNGGEIHP